MIDEIHMNTDRPRYLSPSSEKYGRVEDILKNRSIGSEERRFETTCGLESPISLSLTKPLRRGSMEMIVDVGDTSDPAVPSVQQSLIASNCRQSRSKNAQNDMRFHSDSPSHPKPERCYNLTKPCRRLSMEMCANIESTILNSHHSDPASVWSFGSQCDDSDSDDSFLFDGDDDSSEEDDSSFLSDFSDDVSISDGEYEFLTSRLGTKRPQNLSRPRAKKAVRFHQVRIKTFDKDESCSELDKETMTSVDFFELCRPAREIRRYLEVVEGKRHKPKSPEKNRSQFAHKTSSKPTSGNKSRNELRSMQIGTDFTLELPDTVPIPGREWNKNA